VTDYRYDLIAIEDRVKTVKACLVKGHNVGVGLTLDQGFEEVTTGIWQGRTGAVTGRHMVHIYGYEPDAFLIQHWWQGWGFGRCQGRIAPSVLESIETTDFVTTVLDLDKW
jgi:hypothetical protein